MVYDLKKKKFRELNLIWKSGRKYPCIPSMEGMAWDPYAFPKGEKWGLIVVKTGAAPGFLLFLWKQNPTLFMRQRKCLIMHELRGQSLALGRTGETKKKKNHHKNQDLQTQPLQNQGLTETHLITLLVKWWRKRKHQLLL